MGNVGDVGPGPIRIRAHHILCMHGFQGLGYNKEFTANMAQIIEEIRKNPSSFIEIIVGVDSICENCPHKTSQGICNKESEFNNISDMDSKILQKLDIKEGSILSSSIIQSLAMNLSRQTVNKICGNCSWRNHCLYFQEKML